MSRDRAARPASSPAAESTSPRREPASPLCDIRRLAAQLVDRVPASEADVCDHVDVNDGAPPIPPKLAFALRELGWLKNGELPFLAAQWLVEGFDGPSLRELAGLTRGEVDQIDLRLWREALTDIGVAASNVPVRRTAAPFLARSVLAGELTERRLCEALRPELHADSPSPEPEMDALVYQWDELLDYREYLAGERSPRRRDRGWLDRLDAQNRRAVEALADGNVEEAVAALTEWSAGT